jgi:hypothetical protein
MPLPEQFRAPTHGLRFKDVITAGMNPYVLLGMVPLLRNTAMDHDPILVGEGCAACGNRVVLDGRHRWIASVIAGREDVLAIEERRTL